MALLTLVIFDEQTFFHDGLFEHGIMYVWFSQTVFFHSAQVVPCAYLWWETGYVSDLVCPKRGKVR
jgi:hypothetical protein